MGGAITPEQRKRYNQTYYLKHQDELRAKGRIRGKGYYRRNRDRVLAACRDYNAKHHDRRLELQRARNALVRLKVLMAYGGACACCGEPELEFLEVDHVDNDGPGHLKQPRGDSYTTYRYLIRKGYPSGYQVLCGNCNWSKYRGGGVCVHKRATQKLT